MTLRYCDEKEIKAELLLRNLLECIDDKMRVANRAGKRTI